jgi:hypothetical protein
MIPEFVYFVSEQWRPGVALYAASSKAGIAIAGKPHIGYIFRY